MSDWHALKVTELKDELKSRGIPLTGLKLKQQLVDKLVEIDAQQAGDDAPAAQTRHADNDVIEAKEVQPEASANDQEPHKDATATEEVDDATAQLPPALVAEESNATEQRSPSPVAATEDDAAKTILRDDPFLPEVATQDTEMQESNGNHAEDLRDNERSTEEEISQEQAGSRSWRRKTSKSDFETQTSTRVPTPDILDDQRKRKRRSASPPLNTQEMNRKKARTDTETVGDDDAATAALEQIQAATDRAEISRQPNDGPEEPSLQPMEANSDVAAMHVAKEVGSMPDAPELGKTGTSKTESASPRQSPARQIAQAIHPTTRSLYIRNFKRPLHIPTLRNFVSTLAKSAESGSDADPVKTFFLDTIRTHALISFSSTAAASRVRDAMHDTKFPDEPMREPLWIDYIPDEKVQTWIDEESSSGTGGFGGSRSGRKFEVRYDETAEGVKASLHDGAGDARRPTTMQQRPSRAEQNLLDPVATGIHPDRAALVAPKIARPPSKQDAGKGFKALDELFDSTRTKPKLYFKKPNQSVIDRRLDMINTLRLGHGDMGKSGDEGMKRYTFEGFKGREEWVDKGPEFGFGRKGQDRLTGFRGRGGGPRGSRRGGDSWRGR